MTTGNTFIGLKKYYEQVHSSNRHHDVKYVGVSIFTGRASRYRRVTVYGMEVPLSRSRSSSTCEMPPPLPCWLNRMAFAVLRPCSYMMRWARGESVLVRQILNSRPFGPPTYLNLQEYTVRLALPRLLLSVPHTILDTLCDIYFEAVPLWFSSFLRPFRPVWASVQAMLRA